MVIRDENQRYGQQFDIAGHENICSSLRFLMYYWESRIGIFFENETENQKKCNIAVCEGVIEEFAQECCSLEKLKTINKKRLWHHTIFRIFYLLILFWFGYKYIFLLP